MHTHTHSHSLPHTHTHRFVTIPKSTKEARIIENLQTDFKMDEADVRGMSSWNCNMTTGWDPTVGA